jgi:hypothetical protein
LGRNWSKTLGSPNYRTKARATCRYGFRMPRGRWRAQVGKRLGCPVPWHRLGSASMADANPQCFCPCASVIDAIEDRRRVCPTCVVCTLGWLGQSRGFLFQVPPWQMVPGACMADGGWPGGRYLPRSPRRLGPFRHGGRSTGRYVPGPTGLLGDDFPQSFEGGRPICPRSCRERRWAVGACVVLRALRLAQDKCLRIAGLEPPRSLRDLR